VEANSTGGLGSRRAVAPNDDDDDQRGKIGFRDVIGLVLSVLKIQYFLC
jgi:hypothetical protein